MRHRAGERQREAERETKRERNTEGAEENVCRAGREIGPNAPEDS